jgi:hypothetical protein
MTYSTAEEIRFIDGMARTREDLRRKGTKFTPMFMDELPLLKRYLKNFTTIRTNYELIDKKEVVKHLKERIKRWEK